MDPNYSEIPPQSGGDEGSPEDKLHKKLIRWHKEAAEYMDDTNNKGRQTLAFANGVNQWPDAIVKLRNDDADNPRPALTINMCPQFINQVVNDYKQNRSAILVRPVDDKADVDTAEVYNGIIRHIEAVSDAETAYDTAIYHTATHEQGYLRAITQYENDDTFNQEIRIKRVVNPFSVLFDPLSVELDRSDARYVFIVDVISEEDAKEMYGDDVTSFPADCPSSWYVADKKAVQIAECFYKEEVEDTLYLLTDGAIVAARDLQKKPADNVVARKRTVKRQVIKWCKLSGAKIVETGEWAGKYFPVVPVFGNEVYLEDKLHITGIVQGMADSQRMVNYWASAQTELIALSPKSPWVIAEGQIEGYEAIWNTANSKPWSHLPYKPTTIEGELVPAPQRQSVEAPVQALVQARAQAVQDMKATTGLYEASLGAKGNEVSGRAILARQAEGDTATFHYIDNMSKSIKYLGKVLVDLIPRIYDTERVMKIIGEDGENKNVTINAEFTDENGIQRIYELGAGTYDVVTDSGPAFATKRQMAVYSMTELVKAYPALMEICGDLMLKNMDWPGAQELARRFAKTLPPEVLDEENPLARVRELEAQSQQLGQMVEQMKNALEGLESELEEARLKIANKNGELEVKRIEAAIKQKELAIKEMEVRADIAAQQRELAIRQYEARVKGIEAQQKAEAEEARIAIEAKNAETAATEAEESGKTEVKGEKDDD